MVTINDVGPRDGLQNQPKHLNVAERVQLIHALCDAGLKEIEIGAFVSPKAVPAMAGSDQVAHELDLTEARYAALVPNLRGYETSLEVGVPIVAMVVYGSETMAEKNVRMSRAQAEQATIEMLNRSEADGVEVIATIATSFACPFDGPTDPRVVRDTAQRLLAHGAKRIVIADTIGAANPRQVSKLMSELVSDNHADALACHFHDTRALGVANVYAALEQGINHFDASIAGLGGCPFAPGATGNVATEDVVMMLHSMGVQTGVDIDKLLAASDLAAELTGSAPGGRSKPWLVPYLAKGKLL